MAEEQLYADVSWGEWAEQPLPCFFFREIQVGPWPVRSPQVSFIWLAS